MRIIVAGGTGFLGSAFTHAVVSEGDEVAVLTRGDRRAPRTGPVRTVHWTPDGEAGSWAAEIDGAGAIVNLAGEPIAERRWSAVQKGRIRTSRQLATRSLVRAIQRASNPPAVFVSGSAVGYYGRCGDEDITEESPPGQDFLASVAVDWEAEAAPARTFTRVVCLRTGLVLAKDGGALPRMLLPFKVGAGGRLGNGRQHWPWIHRDDWIQMVRWIIGTPAVAGPLNATAPHPVTNAHFARALGRALHRPASIPTPAWVLRTALGEMADGLLLSGQRALPMRAQHLGFTFHYTRLPEALSAIFGRR